MCLSLHSSAYVRCSALVRPSAPALQCLDLLPGAGELPWLLAFFCVCAGPVPVAPAVGAELATMVAHGVGLCVCGIFASCMYSALIGGLLPYTSCSVVGLHWWAGVSCACVPLMVSCSGFGLPMHARLLRLLVIYVDACDSYITWQHPRLLPTETDMQLYV